MRPHGPRTFKSTAEVTSSPWHAQPVQWSHDSLKQLNSCVGKWDGVCAAAGSGTVARERDTRTMIRGRHSHDGAQRLEVSLDGQIGGDGDFVNPESVRW